MTARDKDAEEKLLDRFRDPADPLRFVIVTSKLLTGFEAPILQVMYLDKPMKDQGSLALGYGLAPLRGWESSLRGKRSI
ncbi:MAG: hypothetical protein AB1898_06805 [Acidobacteriota bacterium]